MLGDNIILELTSISKEFTGVKALSNIDFTVKRGEVHALVGENGAGKSTLMKILCGIYQPTIGEIRVNGQEVGSLDPQSASKLGIAMVHQEPKLCANLSITENIFLGRLPISRGIVDWTAAHQAARAVMERVGMMRDPAEDVQHLSIADRQLLQIAKALVMDAQIIILDEPTASLTPVEVDILFKVVTELQAKGVAFVYISHHLDEIFRIAERVTVLKDGVKVAERRVSSVTKDELVSLMVGRELGNRFPPRGRSAGAVAIEVRGLTGKNFRDIDLVVRRGEVLGIAGLIGSGRTELARAICGADPYVRGDIILDGVSTRFRNPNDAIKRGVAYIAEDRRDGAFYPLTVAENIVAAAPEAIIEKGILQPAKRDALASEFISKLRIRTPSPQQQMRLLSGGNQQKCILARWMIKGVDVIFFDEPTRGIDVGAKTEIYRLIDQLALSGKAIVMISSELPEVIGLSDRILVMSSGRVAGEESGNSATEESLLELALRFVQLCNEVQ